MGEQTQRVQPAMMIVRSIFMKLEEDYLIANEYKTDLQDKRQSPRSSTTGRSAHENYIATLKMKVKASPMSSDEVASRVLADSGYLMRRT